MCFNNDDQVLWDEDPHDVRKGYDMDFVTELVRKRGKDTSPNSYSSSFGEAPLEQKPYRQKDGALLAVGTLCDKLRQAEPYKSELENMLLQHVFPEFSSPAGHLRAKDLVTAFAEFVNALIHGFGETCLGLDDADEITLVLMK
uniref:Uncharacterized protein n=1 Tax=Brassica oleracea var. oleracea TaxID=109376 RepID=A0A0D2ZSI8_BRAOL